MKRDPQLDFSGALSEWETGYETVAGICLGKRCAELRAAGAVIEAMDRASASNSCWIIHWRKKRQA